MHVVVEKDEDEGVTTKENDVEEKNEALSNENGSTLGEEPSVESEDKQEIMNTPVNKIVCLCIYMLLAFA